MRQSLLSAFCARRSEVRARWTELLRAEPVRSPLGHPDSLVHLIDWTLTEVIQALQVLPSRHRPAPNLHELQSHCSCGQNPLLTYFSAGEQALQEALVLAQAAEPGLDPLERDASLVELNLALHRIARREIEAFCGICQYRQKPDHGHVHTHTHAHAAAEAPAG